MYLTNKQCSFILGNKHTYIRLSIKQHDFLIFRLSHVKICLIEVFEVFDNYNFFKKTGLVYQRKTLHNWEHFFFFFLIGTGVSTQGFDYSIITLTTWARPSALFIFCLAHLDRLLSFLCLGRPALRHHTQLFLFTNFLPKVGFKLLVLHKMDVYFWDGPKLELIIIY
jgi:hypothetical protein